MRKFGLIGYPLGHSFSKAFFLHKFQQENINDCIYDNYPIENIDRLNSIIQQDNELIGLNVTIPYKQQVISFLDEIEEQALAVGAINTIKIFRNNNKFRLKGFNTDVYGFEETLKEVLNESHRNALILGTGGASKAVAYVFNKMNIHFKYVSRSPKNQDILSYSQVTPDVIEKNTIIVNTSPLGMSPNLETWPDIPYDAITETHILYDLIYNPEKTAFLQKGEQKKAVVLNGMPMLRLQAEKAWEIWNS